MSQILISGADNLDKRYLARCLKALKEWGAPLERWYCLEVIDVREDDPEAPLWTCELCGCDRVRFVHVMDNPLYFEPVRVGCICAGIMEGNILAAEERERQMRNRAKRRRNFVKKQWKRSWRGSWSRTYRRKLLTIMKRDDGSYFVIVGGRQTRTYRDKPIRDFYSAVNAAFDLADPKVKAR